MCIVTRPSAATVTINRIRRMIAIQMSVSVHSRCGRARHAQIRGRYCGEARTCWHIREPVFLEHRGPAGQLSQSPGGEHVPRVCNVLGVAHGKLLALVPC